jgi:predicted hydrolase (HD superfamily)
LHPETKLCGDTGYQGLQKIHANSQTPHKAKRNKKLTRKQKKENRKFSRTRVRIENVIRRCKTFRAVKETYRGKHKNYDKTWLLVALLVNLKYPASI